MAKYSFILLILLFSCAPKVIEKTTTITKIDTLFIKKNISDTIIFNSNPNITILDTNKILLSPFIASVDSIFKFGNKDVKIKATYNQPDNKFSLNINQAWLDSIMQIRRVDTVKQNTQTTEYVNRLEWYMYLILGGLFIFAIAAGIFLSKLIK